MKITPEDILSRDILLVGKTNDILIVGRKSKGEALEIVNAFQGEEAEELYKRLTTEKKA